MSRYAQGSEVKVDRSLSEIRAILERYGAQKFGYVDDLEKATAEVAFQVKGRGVRMRLRLPPADEFLRTGKGKKRAVDAARREWEAAVRQKWRCLVLVIKAKLEAIESGIATFEDEWLAYLVCNDGRTVGERIIPQLVNVSEEGGPLLIGFTPNGGEVSG